MQDRNPRFTKSPLTFCDHYLPLSAAVCIYVHKRVVKDYSVTDAQLHFIIFVWFYFFRVSKSASKKMKKVLVPPPVSPAQGPPKGAGYKRCSSESSTAGACNAKSSHVGPSSVKHKKTQQKHTEHSKSSKVSSQICHCVCLFMADLRNQRQQWWKWLSTSCGQNQNMLKWNLSGMCKVGFFSLFSWLCTFVVIIKV